MEGAERFPEVLFLTTLGATELPEPGWTATIAVVPPPPLTVHAPVASAIESVAVC